MNTLRRFFVRPGRKLASYVVASFHRYFSLVVVLIAVAVSACSSGSSSANPAAEEAIEAGEELAVTSQSAPLTREQLINLAMAMAVGENFDGEQIAVDDDLLRTLATIHIRSSAIVDFLQSQDDETFDLGLLEEQAVEGVTSLIDNGLINELDSESIEFAALANIILTDRSSNPLRAEVDPQTGESVVGDNPFTSSFVFDPNLTRNFNTVSPGFLDQFNDTFTEFTADVAVASDLGTWNPETFAVDAP